jgi:hypothetical protein
MAGLNGFGSIIPVKLCLRFGKFAQFQAVFDPIQTFVMAARDCVNVLDVALHCKHVATEIGHFCLEFANGSVQLVKPLVHLLHRLKHQFIRDLGHLSLHATPG